MVGNGRHLTRDDDLMDQGNPGDIATSLLVIVNWNSLFFHYDRKWVAHMHNSFCFHTANPHRYSTLHRIKGIQSGRWDANWTRQLLLLIDTTTVWRLFHSVVLSISKGIFIFCTAMKILKKYLRHFTVYRSIKRYFIFECSFYRKAFLELVFSQQTIILVTLLMILNYFSVCTNIVLNVHFALVLLRSDYKSL